MSLLGEACKALWHTCTLGPCFGALWGHLVHFWNLFGEVLEPTWDPQMGPSIYSDWGSDLNNSPGRSLGLFRGSPGDVLEPPAIILDPLDPLLEPFGPSWATLGAPGGHLGCLWGQLALKLGVLVHVGLPLGSLWVGHPLVGLRLVGLYSLCWLGSLWAP